MGVPRLFRLLVERYPLILRGLDEPPTPEFDNLYLDFNGIVHTCTHGNEQAPTRTQHEMMMAIFSAIEELVEAIKPTSLLFIAIDGVAPRAKMIQQRQRRFKAVRARKKFEKDNPEAEDTFDSNCITPGTEFMATLEQYLVYFIQRKIEEDASWRKLEVILSGHRVPGEGEHKIMDFVRHLKSEDGYDPNTRHCIHGLDADLIMLALATHEPHFCILREKVILRRRRKVVNDLSNKDTVFQHTQELQLIHVGLLREYLHLELSLRNIGPDFRQGLVSSTAALRDAVVDAKFRQLPAEIQQHRDAIAQSRSIERLIDDFVFLTFLLGNDFLPHLVCADLDDDGLDAIFSAYREAVNSPDLATRYLVNAEKAKVDLPFLRRVFEIFSRTEQRGYQTEAKTEKAKATRRVNKNKTTRGAAAKEKAPTTGEGAKAASSESSQRKPQHVGGSKKEKQPTQAAKQAPKEESKKKPSQASSGQEPQARKSDEPTDASAPATADISDASALRRLLQGTTQSAPAAQPTTTTMTTTTTATTPTATTAATGTAATATTGTTATASAAVGAEGDAAVTDDAAVVSDPAIASATATVPASGGSDGASQEFNASSIFAGLVQGPSPSGGAGGTSDAGVAIRPYSFLEDAYTQEQDMPYVVRQQMQRNAGHSRHRPPRPPAPHYGPFPPHMPPLHAGVGGAVPPPMGYPPRGPPGRPPYAPHAGMRMPGPRPHGGFVGSGMGMPHAMAAQPMMMMMRPPAGGRPPRPPPNTGAPPHMQQQQQQYSQQVSGDIDPVSVEAVEAQLQGVLHDDPALSLDTTSATTTTSTAPPTTTTAASANKGGGSALAALLQQGKSPKVHDSQQKQQQQQQQKQQDSTGASKSAQEAAAKAAVPVAATSAADRGSGKRGPWKIVSDSRDGNQAPQASHSAKKRPALRRKAQTDAASKAGKNKKRGKKKVGTAAAVDKNVARAGSDQDRKAVENDGVDNDDVEEADEEEEEPSSQWVVGVGSISTVDDYYRVKFEEVEGKPIDRHTLVKEYLEGLLWTLHYYYQGVASWSWFYAHYAAPLPSDILDACDVLDSIAFDQSTAPLLPFEQLLTVLPAESSALLPSALQDLPHQQLSEFYPSEYPCVPDVRGREWRDIVVIPVIDGAKLKTEYTAAIARKPLSQQEEERNSHRVAMHFEFDIDQHHSNNPPPNAGRLRHHMVHCLKTNLSMRPLSDGRFVPRVLPGCHTGPVAPPPAFPTLKFLRFTATLERLGVTVIGGRSRLPTLCIKLQDGLQSPGGRVSAEEQRALEKAERDPENVETYAEEIRHARRAQTIRALMDRVYTVDYPFPCVGKIVSARDEEGRHRLRRGQIKVERVPGWEDERAAVHDRYQKKRGVDVGDTELLLEVAPLRGVVQTKAFDVVEDFDTKNTFLVPAQAIPATKPRPDPRFAPSSRDRTLPLLQKGDACVCVVENHFGAAGTVAAVKRDSREEIPLYTIKTVPTPPHAFLADVAAIAKRLAAQEEEYLDEPRAARAAGLHTLSFSRLCSCISVVLPDGQRADVGLGIKFARRQLYMAGYSRCVPDKRRGHGATRWQYTRAAVAVMQDLRSAFPALVSCVDAAPRRDKYDIAEIYQDTPHDPAAVADELLAFLGDLPTTKHPLLPCDSKAMPTPAIMELEQEIDRVRAEHKGDAVETLRVREDGVRPAARLPLLLPADQRPEFHLGHRVVSSSSSGPVPFGSTGTVVGVEAHGQRVQVLFDEPFLSGSNLRGRCRAFRGFTVPHWSLLNLSTCAGRVAKQRSRSRKPEGSKPKKGRQPQAASTSNPFAALDM